VGSECVYDELIAGKISASLKAAARKAILKTNGEDQLLPGR
jgi:hypothetical protein